MASNIRLYGTCPAIIVNAHGPMAELPEDCVATLPDEFDDTELAVALDRLRADAARRAA